MCHEYWNRRMREQAREEEGRRFWDLFDRETRHDPPQPVADTERDDREPAAPDRDPLVTRR